MCRCSPWFDAGDDSLDLVVDLVDGGVVCLVVGAEGWVRRLSPWGGQSRVSCTVFGDLLRF